jgi:hypothetical protein
MKTNTNENDFVRMPPDLLAEARAAADEEHRPAEELVRDAVKRYLELRREQHDQAAPRKNLAQFLMESPFAGAELDLERRKEYVRPPEL